MDESIDNILTMGAHRAKVELKRLIAEVDQSAHKRGYNAGYGVAYRYYMRHEPSENLSLCDVCLKIYEDVAGV